MTNVNDVIALKQSCFFQHFHQVSPEKHQCRMTGKEPEPNECCDTLSNYKLQHYYNTAITIIKHSHLAHKSAGPVYLSAADAKSDASSFIPISAHIPITLQMWLWVRLKVPDLSKCAGDEVDVTAVSVGQGPAGCVCSWQWPVFNIYLNRNAISWLMWLDPIWQWSLSLVFLPSVILLPSRDLKGLKITAPRYTYITFLSLSLSHTFWKHVINEAFSLHNKSKCALICYMGFDLWPHLSEKSTRFWVSTR